MKDQATLPRGCPPLSAIERHYCPACEGAIPAENMIQRVGVTEDHTFDRAVYLFCDHCSAGSMIRLRFSGGNWILLGTPTRMTVDQAKDIIQALRSDYADAAGDVPFDRQRDDDETGDSGPGHAKADAIEAAAEAADMARFDGVGDVDQFVRDNAAGLMGLAANAPDPHPGGLRSILPPHTNPEA